MVGERASDSVPVIHEVYPYLHVRGGAAAIDFYKGLFGAQELLRLAEPDGRIAHAELKLGPVTLMLVDEYPDYDIQSPLAFGGTGTTMHLPPCGGTDSSSTTSAAAIGPATGQIRSYPSSS